MLDQEMNSNNPNASIWPHALRNGVIWGLIGITIQLGLYFSGMLEATINGEASFAVTALSAILGIVVAVWFITSAIKSFREERGGLTFGNAVGVGAATGLIYGAIAAVWTLIFFSVIFPDFYDIMLEGVYAQYEEAGMDEDQIESAMGIVKMMSNPTVGAISSLIGGALYGIIISLIAGIFMKTD